MPAKVEISYKTIIFTTLFLISLWLILQITDIIFLVYISFIIMSAFKPVMEFLIKKHLPRILSVIIIYACFLIVIAFVGSFILPPVVSQTIRLGEKMPEYISAVLPMYQFDIQMLSQQIAPLSENLLKVTISLFSNIITLFTIFVVSFYFLMEREHLENHLSLILGKEGADKIGRTTGKIEEKLGAWVRGQLTLGITIGLMTFVGLSLLGMPFILSLSLLAGILEIVPIIGPIISAIPAVLIALTISPILSLATVALYFVIQQIEAQLVVPMVIQRAVGLPPVVSIVALMVGAKLDGILGALLAVPVILTVEIIFAELYRNKKNTFE